MRRLRRTELRRGETAKRRMGETARRRSAMLCGFAPDRWGENRWGENLGAPWMLPPQSVKPPPDLSRAVGPPATQNCREPNHVYLETTMGRCHPHGAAQTRRGLSQVTK